MLAASNSLMLLCSVGNTFYRFLMVQKQIGPKEGPRLGICGSRASLEQFD